MNTSSRNASRPPRAIKAGTTQAPVAVTDYGGEPRVDSRVLAVRLQGHHKSVMELIDRYRGQLGRFGIVPFETEKLEGSGRGRPERYALLNENQSYFLLSLSRNTDHVVNLKANLVEAFGKLRQAAKPEEEYLPSYRDLHKRVHDLAANSSNVQFVHMNFNKLINRTAGIAAGQRATLESASRSLVCVAQALATRAMSAANDHHDGYQAAKVAMRDIEPIAKRLAAPAAPRLS
ncbi:Rha family transcriptional regulator [uncultured Pseudacidovorax sp.]|uniref:Rha family transcriptional regulator n=1 Tax=uncultured Pseudacidovorax sp. TaxID=679313 RepID=UPI0025DC3B39|nr:Rha family transcriptional regulator [uncultured Pseudacidovorax sp.]